MKTFICTLTFLLITAVAEAKLNVVTTLPDFAAIAKEVGGNEVEVTSLAKGPEDAHYVEPKPSFIRVLNKADILVEGGADLEVGWLPPLLASARNKKIIGDASGHVVLSQTVKLRGVPTEKVDRSMGDVHPLGNPHYALDPLNGKKMAEQIAEAFSQKDPGHAAVYRKNLATFCNALDRKIAEWDKALQPFRGTKVVTYHKSFDYLLEHFGLELAGTIEPKPGIEPSPTHIKTLISETKEAGVKLVIVEPFRPRKTPEQVAEAIGAKLLVLPEKVGANDRASDYLRLFDYNVSQIANALK